MLDESMGGLRVTFSESELPRLGVSNNEVLLKYDIPPETRYIGLAFGSLRTCIRSIFEAQTIFGAYSRMYISLKIQV